MRGLPVRGFYKFVFFSQTRLLSTAIEDETQQLLSRFDSHRIAFFFFSFESQNRFYCFFNGIRERARRRQESCFSRRSSLPGNFKNPNSRFPSWILLGFLIFFIGSSSFDLTKDYVEVVEKTIAFSPILFSDSFFILFYICYYYHPNGIHRTRVYVSISIPICINLYSSLRWRSRKTDWGWRS